MSFINTFLLSKHYSAFFSIVLICWASLKQVTLKALSVSLRIGSHKTLFVWCIFVCMFLGVQPFPTNCVFSIQKSDVTLTSIWPDRHKLSNNNHTFVLFVSMFWLHAFWRTALENVCTHHNTKGHFFRCTSAM